MRKILFLILLFMTVFLTSCNSNESAYIDYNTIISDNKDQYKNEVADASNSNVENSQDKTSEGNKNSVNPREDNFKDTMQSQYSGLDNTKKGWGLKRNSEHLVPEVGRAIKDIFDKYNTIYVDNAGEKVVYLTFDEGYENGYTSQILDVLKENNVRATFFITGPYLEKNAELVDRMVNEGHIVGNHTINHLSLPTITSEKIENEVIGLDRIFYEKYKINMRYMRPPMGEYSERVISQLKDLGHTTVLWSFAYLDYDVNNQKGTDYAYNMVMDNLHPGAILLLHAVSKDNANALDQIIKDIRAQGYEIKNLDSIK